MKEKNLKIDEKHGMDSLTVGSDAKDITFEGLLQGLKLKKDLHFGKLSEQSWKSNRPLITKVNYGILIPISATSPRVPNRRTRLPPLVGDICDIAT